MATTEELMEQYGVAWFDFDEASGNVVDKLGNGYTGTVTGATRVTGWNGEGSAMNFNGSSFITFNSKILPIREKSIKFKVKTSMSSSSRLIATSDWMKQGSGVTIQNGLLAYFITYSDNVGTTNYSENFFSNKLINDRKWHEILISVNSVKKKVVIYIDGVADAILNVNNSFETSNTYDLLIGKDQTATNINFNGQIDDLQIYNKALSPSDFTQKRLVVKTSDNKNLVLSPNTARVKEIPNTAEYMMLAQSGPVREIDSAVDSQPIDFTKATTEYEIVTNNRTPLGKGRMFTIPIGSDFKTAMIEDNY